MDRRRKLTFISIGLLFLLSGVEYAVILPTIWMYLQTLDAAPYFLGLALSAFSLSGLLSGPLFGFWSDRTGATKKIILFSNLFEIIGNFMYFMGFSKWLLLSSRLVAGIGTGAGSSIFGFLTRITAPEDRATVFAAIMASRQVGLLIGPAFNLFLRLCDFHLGPFVVNKYTSPGLFMCLLWAVFQVLVVFMFSDVPPTDMETCKKMVVESDEREPAGEDSEEREPLLRSQELAASAGSASTSKRATYHASDTAEDHISPLPSPEQSGNWESSDAVENVGICQEFLKESVIVLFVSQFIILFNQTALETMVTPMTQKYFNYGELENSIMYFLCAVVVISSFLFVRWLSQRVSERVVLAIGLAICNISCVWCLVFVVKPLGGFSLQLTEFIIGVFLQVLGLPFVAVAQVSLFSKVTAQRTQGFSQGVRRSIGGLATILGPLWAGGLIDNMYIMIGLMLGLLALLTLMVALSYNRLVAPTIVEQLDESDGSG
ncbi:major facilitator superfamily domain-containing protein 8 [Brachionichthys hirsutus]|uniref:major facilitator superfamily domain-containing protein 8 n=1 Tax=Brachionichthys hirsutus TaxID=412623 RepID=UPI003604AD0C